MHRSTAIHLAVLFQKPLIFLTNDNYPNYSKRWTKQLANYFEKEPVNTSNITFNKEIFNNEMKFNKTIYKNFKRDFIVDLKNSKRTSYEIVFNTINKNF